MKKFLLLTLVVLAIFLSLASCGKDKPTTTQPTLPEEPPVHEHNYEVIIADPTCTEKGVAIYTCECGDSYDVAIDALGHTESDWIIDLEPTTKAEGSKHTECTACGITFKTETIEKLPLVASEGLEFALNEDGKSYSVVGIGTCKDTDIVIPDTYEGLPVTSIGDFAFENCNTLTSITIPDSVTSIGEEAFANCLSLTSVTIPAAVTSIGKGPFACCISLSSIEVDEKNVQYKSIDGNLYTNDETVLIQYAVGKQDRSFEIPNSVTSIGDGAFSGCKSLISITIPDSVTSIGSEAFDFCPSLPSIIIPDSVTSIGVAAFSGCKSLKSITIPDSVTSIGNYTFYACDSLTSISIPDSVTSIGDWAFYYCTSLPSITIPDSVTSIGRSAFSSCDSLTSINIPDSVTSIGNYAFDDCCLLASIEVDENNPKYKSIEGNLYNKDGTILIRYAIGKKDTSFVIPTGVTNIGNDAFFGCDSLTSVTIGSSVTSIGEFAFSWCGSLTSVTIGNSVTSIGRSAFSSCDSLTSVTIGNSVTSIGDSAFSWCPSLTSIVIPDSVTEIGYWAFNNCDSLTIYCEATSQPNSWYSDWNCGRPVVWGYKGE